MIRYAVVLCILGTLFMGCESTSELKQGGYRMIQMNKPECMGSSGSGILLVRDSDGSIVKAQIGQKTGYCEAITGQVISTGGDVAGDYLMKQGLSKSGRTTNSNTTTTSQGGITTTVPTPPVEDPNTWDQPEPR